MSGGGRRLGAVVLAAGEARRFGRPKQLLVWRGQALVERAVRSCLAAGCERVVAVTGAHAPLVAEALAGAAALPAVSLTQNPQWAAGLHTSLARGIDALLAAAGSLDAVLVALADQPLVDGPFLARLAAAQVGADAAALGYPSGPGVPACFGAAAVGRLRTLAGGVGAKALLRDPTLRTVVVDDPPRRRDVDTPAEWAALLAAEPDSTVEPDA